jgi:hypothetical protein
MTFIKIYFSSGREITFCVEFSACFLQSEVRHLTFLGFKLHLLLTLARNIVRKDILSILSVLKRADSYSSQHNGGQKLALSDGLSGIRFIILRDDGSRANFENFVIH